MTTASFAAQHLPNRCIIALQGEQVVAFLHNLLTVELLQLQSGQAVYGALLSPQGKILHDVFVIATDTGFFLDCAMVQAQGLLQKLLLYRLRAKIDIRLDPGHEVAVSPQANLAGCCYADPRHHSIGFRSVIAAGSLAVGCGYDDARLAVGLADSDGDIGSGELFVHEANLDQLHGVSFKKGCYVGQEVVSRSHHRATSRNRILPVAFEGEIQRGTEIRSGDVRLGEMLSSHGGRGLALLRLDRLAETRLPLLAGLVQVHASKPAWAKFELSIPAVAQ